MLVFGERFRTSDVSTRVRIAFSPGLPARQVSTLNGISGDVPFMWLGSYRVDGLTLRNGDAPRRFAPALDEAADRLTVERHRRSFQLDLRGIGGAMKAMHACTDRLVLSWGYDPAAQSGYARKAVPATPPADWLTPRDVPPGAWETGQSAIMHVRLDVDAAGGITGCAILRQSSNEAFGKRASEALRRKARFLPALDEARLPVKDYWTAGYVYRSGG